METKQHSVGDLLSVVPLNTSLTYICDKLEKQLKSQEVVLPGFGRFELKDVIPGVFQVENLVDEAVKGFMTFDFTKLCVLEHGNNILIQNVLQQLPVFGRRPQTGQSSVNEQGPTANLFSGCVRVQKEIVRLLNVSTDTANTNSNLPVAPVLSTFSKSKRESD